MQPWQTTEETQSWNKSHILQRMKRQATLPSTKKVSDDSASRIWLEEVNLGDGTCPAISGEGY